VERKRSQLRDIHVRALDALAEIWIDTGDPLLAARDAEESIALERYREVGYQWLMRAQAAASNRGEAVRAFRRCRDTLARDLGVEPSPVTRAVFNEVVHGAPPATALQRRRANVGSHAQRIGRMEVNDGPNSDV
jgi:DNA-binding SARP family transcriptional activator